jgi:protease II
MLHTVTNIYLLRMSRGGGEYGEEWHSAGTLNNKQNVFDDFLSAALYLCTINLTTPAQLAINGGSNGGLVRILTANLSTWLYAQYSVVYYVFAVSHMFACRTVEDCCCCIERILLQL